MGYEIGREQRCAFDVGETFGRGFRRGRETRADRVVLPRSWVFDGSANGLASILGLRSPISDCC